MLKDIQTSKISEHIINLQSHKSINSFLQNTRPCRSLSRYGVFFFNRRGIIILLLNLNVIHHKKTAAPNKQTNQQTNKETSLSPSPSSISSPPTTQEARSNDISICILSRFSLFPIPISMHQYFFFFIKFSLSFSFFFPINNDISHGFSSPAHSVVC